MLLGNMELLEKCSVRYVFLTSKFLYEIFILSKELGEGYSYCSNLQDFTANVM